MSATIQTISPKDAAVMLKSNVSNRPIDNRVVTSYAEAMMRGEWVLNGEAIIVSDDGVLLDGQHRLAACVKANIPMTAVVVQGIPRAAQATIDRGKGRTPGNVLHLLGEQNANATAGALSFMFRYFNDNISTDTRSTAPSTMQMIGLLENNPGIRDSVRIIEHLRTRGFAKPSMLAAFHYIFGMDDPNEDNALRDAFFDQLRIDFNGERHSSTSLLFSRLVANASSKTAKMPAAVTAALFIKAWKAFKDGMQLKALRWNPAIEDFPKL